MSPKELPNGGEIYKEPSRDDRLILKWLENQPVPNQKNLTEQKLTGFLDQASQPRHASGNACIKLCFFIEQSKISTSPLVRDVAFSQNTCLRLFNFYLEWNEKNQNRSMRQVLELVSSLIVQNPDKKISAAIKHSILQRNLSIISHQAAQPLVKPAFKSLECLLGKGSISPGDLIHVYQSQTLEASRLLNVEANLKTDSAWGSLISESFDWMALADVAPAAGKFLVTIFRELRAAASSETHLNGHTGSWQRWIRRGLSKEPEALDNVKNYLFPPLFKLDRPGSLAFLGELNNQTPISNLQNQEIDAHALLQLAAMEVGKKAGLVEEPSTIRSQKVSKKKAASIVLQEATISPLLIHSSETVRSLAFSVLVSSSSSIKPFSPIALNVLQASMGVLYADTDAKFRNEVLSNTKHMIERLRGATAFLKREVDTLSFSLGLDSELVEPDKVQDNFEATNLMRQHESFLEWYLDFLLGELIPTSSYQRHITALKALYLLLRSEILEPDARSPSPQVADNDTIWPFSIKFFAPGSLRLLLDLLMDPFEDVRSTATAILKLASPNMFTLGESVEADQNTPVRQVLDLKLEGGQTAQEPRIYTNTNSNSPPPRNAESMEMLERFLERAKDTSRRTGRADYADGVARCYELLYSMLSSTDAKFAFFGELVNDLESEVRLAEQDIGRAVLKAPIHGTFAALNFVWDSVNLSSGNSDSEAKYTQVSRDKWNSFQVRMYQSCNRIWDAVKNVLCNDSPEGHLPQDLDEVEAIDTKDVLSYSFRAIHESSNLMRTMASKIRLNWQDSSPLSSLRHRGAFSTVSKTFARFCQLTQHQVSGPSSTQPDLLYDYYQGALRCILEQASTTRRSAGIPALMTGILSSNARNPAFQDVMTELKSLARRTIHLPEIDETNLPQVHAMNCLKEIFKSSLLGKRSESHIADCLQISADSLNSDTWAIRNCGLLLLRSLIDCLFGTSESKVITEAGWDGRSIKLSYDKYPALPELLLKLLDTQISSSDALSTPTIGAVESVFPALDIIRRAGPPDVNRDEIYRRVSIHLGSKVWHVREIAARAICTLLLHDQWLSAVDELLKTCNGSVNRIHGVLMAVKFFLERRLSLDSASATDGLLILVTSLHDSKELWRLECNCAQILAAELELNNTIAHIVLSASKEERLHLRDMTNRIFSYDACSELRDMLGANPAEALLRTAMVRRAIYTTAIRDDSAGLRGILKFVAETSTDITLAALECIPQAWNPALFEGALSELSEAYLVVVENSLSPEVRAIATTNLADALDRGFCMNDEIHREAVYKLRALGPHLSDGLGSPNLSNAEIRVSGWILLQWLLPTSTPTPAWLAERMQAWGSMLSSAGHANKDFDTRYAAAATLHSFFGISQLENIPTDQYLLQPLLALYDTLNDDDDEIRDIGAATVSSILKKPLVPLAAREEFTYWLLTSYSQNPLLAWSVVSRMTGNNAICTYDEATRIRSAESQLVDALQADDALFVEEEQNLFIDEVREVKLWSGIFGQLPQDILETGNKDSPAHSPLSTLTQWAADGLAALNKITKKDGPLGWTSKPSAFTACMRLLSCSNAVLKFHSRYSGSLATTTSDETHSLWGNNLKGVLNELELFITQGIDRNIHQSLLAELLCQSSLELINLSYLIPKISLKSQASWISASPLHRPRDLRRPKAHK